MAGARSSTPGSWVEEVNYEDRLAVGFVVPFVSGYCTERLRYGFGQTKPGKMTTVTETAGQILGGGIGAGAGAVSGVPLTMCSSGGRAAGGATGQKAAEYFSDKVHAKKSRSIVAKTPFMDSTNQATFWPLLAETALGILHCWNHQFKTICDGPFWELILKALAEEAVNRIFNYINDNSGTFVFHVNGLMEAVIHGESSKGTPAVLSTMLPKWLKVFDSMKTGKTLILSEDHQWNTKEFFEHVGLICSGTSAGKYYVWQKRKCRNTAQYGFRKMYDGEDWPDGTKYKLKEINLHQAEFTLGNHERERVKEMVLKKLTNGDQSILAMATNQTVNTVQKKLNDQTQICLAIQERMIYWTSPPLTGRFRSAHNLLLSTPLNLAKLNEEGGFRKSLELYLEYGQMDTAVQSLNHLLDEVWRQEECVTAKELDQIFVLCMESFLALKIRKLRIPEILINLKALCLVGWKRVWDSEGSQLDRLEALGHLLISTVFLGGGLDSEDLILDLSTHLKAILASDLQGMLKCLLVGLLEVFKVLGAEEAVQVKYKERIAAKIDKGTSINYVTQKGGGRGRALTLRVCYREEGWGPYITLHYQHLSKINCVTRFV